MNCMKCGREIDVGQCFCQDCLNEMEKYPVKPGVVVQLPPRPRQTPPKRIGGRRRSLTPEERVKQLKKRVGILWAALILSWALLGAATYVAVEHFLEEDVQWLPGQNYSTAETTEPQETE